MDKEVILYYTIGADCEDNYFIDEFSLSPNVFDSDCTVYHKLVNLNNNIDTTHVDPDIDKVYRGIREVYGYTKENEFCEGSFSFLEEKYIEDPSKKWGTRIETYENGELIETKFMED